MNIKQAESIITIYELGSVTAAANKLFVSQPALSRTIQTIEDELETKLFNRNTLPISLTHAGERYVETARQFITIYDNFLKEIKYINDGTSGKLKIAISSLRGAVILPKILPLYMEMYPNVEIIILEDGSAYTEELLAEGKVDVSFGVEPNMYNCHLLHRELFAEKMFLLAGKGTDIANRIQPNTHIDITETKKEKFVALHKGHGVRAFQDRMFSENEIAPKIMLTTKNIYIACSVAAACNGVTIVPETLVTETMKSGECYYYPIKGNGYTRPYYICYNNLLSKIKYIEDFIELSCTILQNKY